MSASSSLSSSSLATWSPVVIQVRRRDSDDLFEFDLDQPSFALLKEQVSAELELSDPSLIKKISRADNVVVRKDADVQRLKGTCQLVVDV
jgi:hypothetical protein